MFSWRVVECVERVRVNPNPNSFHGLRVKGLPRVPPPSHKVYLGPFMQKNLSMPAAAVSSPSMPPEKNKKCEVFSWRVVECVERVRVKGALQVLIHRYK